MEPKKFSLCPLCEACPEVVITDEGVTIGEDAEPSGCLMLHGTNLFRSSSVGRLTKFNQSLGAAPSGVRHFRDFGRAAPNARG